MFAQCANDPIVIRGIGVALDFSSAKTWTKTFEIIEARNFRLRNSDKHRGIPPTTG